MRVLTALAFFPTLLLAAEDPHKAIRASIAAFSKRSAVSVIDLESGKPLFFLNDHRPLIPASVLKIVLSGAVLDRNDPERAFATEVWVEGRGSAPKSVIIRGGGDPSLTVESAWLLARRLRISGIREIETLGADNTAFIGVATRGGGRAFEAGAAALSFNFNSVGVHVCPGDVGGDATVSIDPWESGIRAEGRVSTVAGKGRSVTLSLDPVKRVPLLTYRVRGELGVNSECLTQYRSIEDPEQFFLETFRRLLEGVGITVKRYERDRVVTSSHTLLVAQRSKPLREILGDLNRFSNNFIAEQLLFLLGEKEILTAPPQSFFERELGLARMSEYLHNVVGIDQQEFSFADGSGLSRENRLSAHAVTRTLRRIALTPSIAPEFETALSVAKRNGTLMRRKGFEERALIRGKTGTLDGVSSLAGYLTTARGRRIAYAVIQNGASGKDLAARRESNLVNTLWRDL